MGKDITDRACPLVLLGSPGDSCCWLSGVKEMGNRRFLCENVVVQRTTPPHVILNNVKDLSKTHHIG